jgi:hypothetical protein
VPQLGELLERFRHAATPGPPAAGGGVPDDATGDLQAELRPVLAALDEVEDESRSVIEEATARAGAIRDEGTRDAERIRQEARLQAAWLQAPPVDRGASDGEARAILAAAEAEADGIRRRARGRIPGFVGRVMTCVAGAAVAEESHVAGVGRG